MLSFMANLRICVQVGAGFVPGFLGDELCHNSLQTWEMEMTSVFTKIEPELLPILEELRRREPIFHNPAFGSTTAEFERSTAPDYWEVGASGRLYSRDFILHELTKSVPYVDAAAAGWETSEFGLRRLGPDTYLLTYTLDQAGRRTRRSTIWRRSEDGWQILYHQGTIIAAEEDDRIPT